MPCGCTRAVEKKFLWVPQGESSESPNCVSYDSEIQAKAKVMRKGGTYIPLVRRPDGVFVAKQ